MKDTERPINPKIFKTPDGVVHVEDSGMPFAPISEKDSPGWEELAKGLNPWSMNAKDIIPGPLKLGDIITIKGSKYKVTSVKSTSDSWVYEAERIESNEAKKSIHKDGESGEGEVEADVPRT